MAAPHAREPATCVHEAKSEAAHAGAGAELAGSGAELAGAGVRA